MTNEEMERAIDFLLKSQAHLEARIEEVNRNLGERIAQTNEQLARTNGQLAQTNRQLGEFADTQADFILVMTRTWEAQGEFNNSMKAANRELAAAQKRTEETVEKLARTVDKLADGWGKSGRG